jgi:diacylglycerol kinase
VVIVWLGLHPVKTKTMTRIQSFKYAFRGLRRLYSSEVNARIHLAISVASIIAGGIYRISTTEWMIVALSIGIVMAMEAMNTAIEGICNFIEPNKHPQIAIIKDLAAGGVLIASMGAAIVGLFIFIPKIFPL